MSVLVQYRSACRRDRRRWWARNRRVAAAQGSRIGCRTRL